MAALFAFRLLTHNGIAKMHTVFWGKTANKAVIAFVKIRLSAEVMALDMLLPLLCYAAYWMSNVNVEC